MAKRIQIRRDTAAIWTTANPTLGQGELGFEIDTKKIKIGDGTTLWNALGYFGGGSTAWVSTLTYTENEIVGYGGKIYISLQNNNLAKNPVTEVTYWEEFTSGGGGSSLEIGRTILVAAGIPASVDLELTDVNKYVLFEGDDDTETTDIVINESLFATSNQIVIEQISIGFFKITPENINVIIEGGAKSWGKNTTMTIIFKTPNLITCIGGQEV